MESYKFERKRDKYGNKFIIIQYIIIITMYLIIIERRYE